MMAPDFAYSRGTYELAKTFYTEYIPELTKLAQHAVKDDSKRENAETLLKRIEMVMDSKNHRWAIDKMGAEEKASRAKALEEFRKRYQK